ncbi:MAG: hypothetical protein J7647_29635 [Cyanobacteria bacterium SBLK]|nr:hypothetical protein [Cyanobacteria bacterium SBLK]
MEKISLPVVGIILARYVFAATILLSKEILQVPPLRTGGLDFLYFKRQTTNLMNQQWVSAGFLFFWEKSLHNWRSFVRLEKRHLKTTCRDSSVGRAED